MGKNTKLPKMTRPPPSGAPKDDGWRKNSQDEVNKHIYDLMLASQRKRASIDQFTEENKKDIEELMGTEGNEEDLANYRRQLDADRKKSLKEAKKLREETERAAAKKRKKEFGSDSDGESKKKKKRKKKKKKSKRDDSDSDSSDSESDSSKKKKKSKRREKDSDSDGAKSKKKDKDKNSDSDSGKSKKKKDKEKSKDKKSRKSKDKDKDKKKKKDKSKGDDKTDETEAKAAAEKLMRPPVVVDKVREAPGKIICVLRNNFGMVEKKILKTGHGRKPEKGNTVKMHYNMYLASGMKKLYSTKDKYQKAYELIVGIENVIKGWDEGVMSMRLGEQARLTISGQFGYGMKGNAELGVPSMADLVIDVDILEVSDDVKLLSFEEIAKRKIASKTVFIDRSGDRGGGAMKFNSAPF